MARAGVVSIRSRGGPLGQSAERGRGAYGPRWASRGASDGIGFVVEPRRLVAHELAQSTSRAKSVQNCSYAETVHGGEEGPIPVSRVLVPSAWDGGDHFSRSALAGTLERPLGGLSAGHAAFHGLPPGGVCLDRPRSPEASVSLLPHRFTLAVGSPRTPRPAVSSLWHFPCPVGRSRRIGGRYPPPCPVEPGLSSRGV